LFDALAFAYDNLDLMTADLERERTLLAKEEPPKSKKQESEEAKARQTKLPFKF
jgi:hypothetical protein